MSIIKIGSTSINLAVEGEGDWLVLLHEIGGTLETWSAMTPALARHFKVLRYDQRGSGGSDKIVPPFKLDQQVDDLSALLDAVGVKGKCHLAGVALGAAFAVRLAARYPERVASIVLACPASGVNAERAKYLEQRAARVEQGGMVAIVELLKNSYPEAVRRDAQAFDGFRERFLANDPVSYAAINRAFAHFDVVPNLPRISCPTLVLSGKHDGLRPPEFVRGLALNIPGAEYQELDGGHIMPVQAPEAMTLAMLDFYRRIGAVSLAAKSP